MINSYSDIKISEKAMKYIKDFTLQCSNECVSVVDKDKKNIISYKDWLSPIHAETACMIEREEVINQFKELIELKIKEWHYGDSCEAKYRREMLKDLLEELKKEEQCG